MYQQARTRTFCCCLPVRFGVFILTILFAIGGTAISAVGWVQVNKLRNLANSAKIALYINSSIYTLLAVLAVFGFVGTIIRNRTMVSTFFSILVAHLVFSIFSGAFTLHNIFTTDRNAIISGCLKGGANSSLASAGSTLIKTGAKFFNTAQAAQVNSAISTAMTTQSCQAAYSAIKGVSVTIFVLVWLMEIWGCVITNNYISQLDEEAALWPSQTKSDIETAQMQGPRPL